MEDPKKKSTFVFQAGILAAAGMLVKVIGLIYRSPLLSIIGIEGNGYYNSAINIYTIILLISSYSIPSAISKVISQRLAFKEYRNAQRVFVCALLYVLVVGGVASILTFVGAPFLVWKNQNAVVALRVLSPTIFFSGFLGVFRGFFQAHGSMVHTSISQILEQIVNAAVSIGAAWILFREGHKADLVFGNDSLAYSYGAGGGTIGTGAGALVALVFCGMLMMSFRKILRRQCRRDKTGPTESYAQIGGLLTVTIFPIVLSSTVYNISSVLDNFFFGQGMDKLGKGNLIAAQWGIFGKYHTLFMIPVAIANALSSSLIPSLSRAVASRDKGQVLNKVSTAIRFSMLIAIPSTVGLMVLSAPINNLLFQCRHRRVGCICNSSYFCHSIFKIIAHFYSCCCYSRDREGYCLCQCGTGICYCLTGVLDLFSSILYFAP